MFSEVTCCNKSNFSGGKQQSSVTGALKRVRKTQPQGGASANRAKKAKEVPPAAPPPVPPQPTPAPTIQVN